MVARVCCIKVEMAIRVLWSTVEGLKWNERESSMTSVTWIFALSKIHEEVGRKAYLGMFEQPIWQRIEEGDQFCKLIDTFIMDAFAQRLDRTLRHYVNMK